MPMKRVLENAHLSKSTGEWDLMAFGWGSGFRLVPSPCTVLTEPFALTSKFTLSTASRKTCKHTRTERGSRPCGLHVLYPCDHAPPTSFFLYLMPSVRQDTALVTAMGGLTWLSILYASVLIYSLKILASVNWG